MYRPSQVARGKASHHGEYELINSNHQQDIDVRALNGKAKVLWWNETDEKPEGLFWRQDFCITTKRLSVSRFLKWRYAGADISLTFSGTSNALFLSEPL
jgi:hypothetical protein